MKKMVPADKTKISSTGSLQWVFICCFKSYCWVWYQRYIYIYMYVCMYVCMYIRTRFAEIYWYNNNNNNNNNNLQFMISLKLSCSETFWKFSKMYWWSEFHEKLMKFSEQLFFRTSLTDCSLSQIKTVNFFL